MHSTNTVEFQSWGYRETSSQLEDACVLMREMDNKQINKNMKTSSRDTV